MARHRIMSVRNCLCAIVIVGASLMGPERALACGNPRLYPLLFQKSPQTKVVYDAELDARRRGHITTPVWSREFSGSYHQWALARATRAVEDLRARLDAVANTRIGPDRDDNVSILLTNEVYIARLGGGDDEVSLKPLQFGLAQGDIHLYTSANVIRALLDDELDWQSALDRKLVVFGAGNRRNLARIEKRLRDALSF